MFPPEVLAVLASRDPVRAVLLDLDFASERKRIHIGNGRLRAGGFDWDGIGEGVTITGLKRARLGTARKATFTLSGVKPEQVAIFRSQRAEVRGRPVRVYVQFYDVDRRPVDTIQLAYRGTMDRMTLKRSAPTSSIVVTAETPWTRRARVPSSGLSDRDQKRRFPGDRMLERLAFIEHQPLYWPMLFA